MVILYADNLLGVAQALVDMVVQVFDLFGTLYLIPGLSLRTILIGFVVAPMVIDFLLKNVLMSGGSSGSAPGAPRPRRKDE